MNIAVQFCKFDTYFGFMSKLKPIFRFFRRPFKKLKIYLKQSAGWLGIPKIAVYRGYGNDKEVFITCRVIEDSGLTKPDSKESGWNNILAAIKRFSSDEIAGVKVKGTLGAQQQIRTSDEYGYVTFRFALPPHDKTIHEKQWQNADFELLDEVIENQPETIASGEVLMVKPDQKRIIVSDIDDTVLVSHSTQTLRKLNLMLFRNAYSRSPFPNASTFYNALQKGEDGNKNYPFFFVSSSEWNLYDLLENFFAVNKIPKGVLLLKKLQHSIYQFWKSGGGNHEHKYEKIRLLMQMYPGHQFILVGDSGQRDPLIYKRLSKDYPGSVEGIYIRKVKGKKLSRFKSISSDLPDENPFLVEVKSFSEAMEHAREKGLIK